ncbi:MAG: hypothetical protein PHV30_10220 [Candidatus Margulisbacteria bacterium]|nr:hypothetical protein [Candidatus Margulisiibacteriota bacterium]
MKLKVVSAFFAEIQNFQLINLYNCSFDTGELANGRIYLSKNMLAFEISLDRSLPWAENYLHLDKSTYKFKIEPDNKLKALHVMRFKNTYIGPIQKNDLNLLAHVLKHLFNARLDGSYINYINKQQFQILRTLYEIFNEKSSEYVIL